MKGKKLDKKKQGRNKKTIALGRGKTGTGFAFNRIKTKLILYFTIVIILSSVLLGYISLRNSRIALYDIAEESIVMAAGEAAKLLQARMDNHISIVEQISILEDIGSMDWEIQKPILENQLKDTSFMTFAIAEPGGSINYINANEKESGDRRHID